MEENPVDASELLWNVLDICIVFSLCFIEARPELGYAPMKFDICERIFSVYMMCVIKRKIAKYYRGYYIGG